MPKMHPRDTSQTPHENAAFVSPIMAPLARRGAGPPLRLRIGGAYFAGPGDSRRFSMKLTAAPVSLDVGRRRFGRACAVRRRRRRSGATALASHRAVYDLKLSTTRGKRAMNAVRGRILYDFSGSACEGYALQFRQVSELDSGEGKVIVSDLRATSWEDGAAKRLRFHSQNFFDEQLARLGRRPGRAGRRRRRGGAEEAGREEARSEERAGVSDRARPPHHRRRARRQDPAAGRGL